ncbi:unnamed protein product [Pleuronectes platessa]|uniref:CCHC-type domain-containing protein n=1 Tax=Pleuronectes platessa TaxID=8262 RepID=A0A9N7UDT8_PLEPL|nr:unnamed protein product [Pleuronectes platessa]
MEPRIQMKRSSAVTEPLFVEAAPLLLCPAALMSFFASLCFPNTFWTEVTVDPTSNVSTSCCMPKLKGPALIQYLHKSDVCIEWDPLKEKPCCLLTPPPTPAANPCILQFRSKLHMEGFRSLKEGEDVEFTFKKSSKGLESQQVTGPEGIHCLGSERRPKGKKLQKRRSKGDRCYNCGGLDHHAKECKLPPQPKKCHFCQSIDHMVANCPIKAQQSSPGSQGKPSSLKGDEEEHSHSALPPETSD